MTTRALARPWARPAGSLVSSVVAPAISCLMLVSGCANGSASSSDDPASSSTGSASATSSRSPSPSPTPSRSSTAASSPRAGASLTVDSPGLLLSADELPGFDDEFQWRAGGTAHREPDASFGTCQRFALLAIGAERVVVRRFRPPPGRAVRHERAGELVATFPDAMTARRAFSVLGAWRARCDDRLTRFARRDVGPLQDVPVDGGQAGWYLLTYGPVAGEPDRQFLDAEGMALVGSRIAMVALVLAGRNDDAAPRQPMVAALQRAAQKLT